MSGLALVTDISEQIFNVPLCHKRTSTYAFVLTMSNVVRSSAVYRQHLCRDPARLR